LSREDRRREGRAAGESCDERAVCVRLGGWRGETRGTERQRERERERERERGDCD